MKIFTKEELHNAFFRVEFVFFIALLLTNLFINALMTYNVFSKNDLIVKSDYPHFYTSALLILEGQGKRIYDFNLQSEYQEKLLRPEIRDTRIPARNPPFAYLAYLPFTSFSFFDSYRLFGLFNLFVIFISAFVASRLFPNIKKFTVVLPFIFAFSFYPTALSLTKGQMTILMTLLYLIFYHLLLKKPFLSGVVYAFFLVKPQFFVAGLPFFFLMTKEKKNFIKGVAMASSVFIFISFIISGLDNLFNYPAYLIGTENALFGSSTNLMFSLHNSLTFISSYIKTPPVAVIVIELLLYIVTVFLFWRRSGNLSFNKNFLLATVFLIIFSVHVLPYDLSLLLVPLFFLLDASLAGEGSTSNWGMVTLTYIFILPNLLAFTYEMNSLVLYGVSLLLLSRNN